MKMEIKREFVATVYIVKDEKVLLTLNEKVNKWVPIGGHVEENELPHETVIRESKEETGFDIELIEASKLGNISQNFSINLDAIKPDHEHINLSYIGKIISGEQIGEFTDDNTELKWFSIEELEKESEIPENVKFSGIQAIKSQQ